MKWTEVFLSTDFRIYSHMQELEKAKARLEEWKAADAQLDEAMAVRKEAFLGWRRGS